MKKIGIGVLATLFIHLVQAQVKLAAKAGWTMSTARAMYNGIKQPTDYVVGFSAGAMAKIPFDGVLHFSPSVTINKRGFVVKPINGPNAKEQYTITYLDLVPSLSFDFPNKENSFVISFGPDFGFTNFGHSKITDAGGMTSSQKMTFGFTNWGWFDLGLTAGAGYHMKKIFIEAGYLHGLASINNNEENDQRNIRNRMFSVSIGYYFR
ncbi:MAG: PorT family protein [Bacteroidetes bacterium]|nr:PorT family protein [Bacteroidota bacterium]